MGKLAIVSVTNNNKLKQCYCNQLICNLKNQLLIRDEYILPYLASTGVCYSFYQKPEWLQVCLPLKVFEGWM